MELVTIKNQDGETFTIDETQYTYIHLGNECIGLPYITKINDETVLVDMVIDCALNKRMQDDNNPDSIGGWQGTITKRYYVDKPVSYFHNVTDDPDVLKQQIRTYYDVEFYIAYSPMMNETDVLFNDTFESLIELIEKAKENKNGEA